MIAPPVLPPTLPPTLPAAPRYTVQKEGYDRAKLQINGVFSRTEVFRLIGELERLGAEL